MHCHKNSKYQSMLESRLIRDDKPWKKKKTKCTAAMINEDLILTNVWKKWAYLPPLILHILSVLRVSFS